MIHHSRSTRQRLGTTHFPRFSSKFFFDFFCKMSNGHSSVQENGTPSLYISDFNFERWSKLTEKAVYTNQKPFLILQHRVTPHLAAKIVTFSFCYVRLLCHVTSSNSHNQISWFFSILGPKVFEKKSLCKCFFCWFGSDNIIISRLDIQSKFLQMFTLFSGCHIGRLRSSNIAAPY